jgi:hypothetical protein
MLIKNNRLRVLIRDSYDEQELQQIQLFLRKHETFNFSVLENGLFPAASVTSDNMYTGYTNVWVRDNVFVAYSHFVQGEFLTAINCISTLMTYFKKHKHRFETIILHPEESREPMRRPHIRFNGNDLMEIDQKWAHAQNDALGYFLWMYCRLLNEEKIILPSEHIEMLFLFAYYFYAIEYWLDEDSGHWEETRKIEASSIGTVLAALKELRHFLQQNTNTLTFEFRDAIGLFLGSAAFKNSKVGFVNDLQSLDSLLQILVEKGTTALSKILPWECIEPNAKQRRYDAALLFLICPLGVVDDSMSQLILDDVIDNLQGEHGIKRYLRDSFWAPNYKFLPQELRTVDVSDDPLWRDALVLPGSEAQWCIFDPILSVIFGRRYQKNHRKEDLALQVKYLNRSLGQLTSDDCPLGALKCPELYYLENGVYAPNDSTPLLWTQANLSLALHTMEDSVRP